MIQKLASFFDLIFTKENLERLEKIVMVAAITGFLIHLLLILLSRNIDVTWAPLENLPKSYLSSIYTPFSIILFYELVLIIEAVPKDFPLSMAKQYEIISLILIRRVFKDVSEFESIESWNRYPDQLLLVGMDLFGGLILFLLVALFYRTYRKEGPKPDINRNDMLVNYEKAIGLLLLVVFVVLSTSSFINWFVPILISEPTSAAGDVGNIFYKDFFGVMVFFDVLLLLISFVFFKGYPEIFRNAGFVLSVILIRISFFSPRAFNVAILITAIGFGLLTLLIYNFLRAGYSRQNTKN